ncbi:hypothetical protein [Verminephrobacter eiseniae]|uniref:hypothetical protein n=1 Tax=Verminephrobacter eiseniae TaxID=364317 RepID=UPI002237ADED|nr:hypothetical protein [Verminephrobacter eiseniae]
MQRRRTWADGWVARLPAPGPIGCKAPGHRLAVRKTRSPVRRAARAGDYWVIAG